MEIITEATVHGSRYVVGVGDKGRGLYLHMQDNPKNREEMGEYFVEWSLCIGDVLDPEAIEVYVDEFEEEIRCEIAAFADEQHGYNPPEKEKAAPSKEELRQHIKVGFECAAKNEIPTEDIVNYLTNHLWGTVGMWLALQAGDKGDIEMFEAYLATAKQSLLSALGLMVSQEHQDEDSVYSTGQLKALVGALGEVRIAID